MIEDAVTVEELIELLSQIEDKKQIIKVWDRNGYIGTNLKVDNDRSFSGNPLIIESLE